jgi:hypothetical protein
MIKNTVSGAKATNNKIGLSVLSGARGKTPQLQAMLTTPGIYADSRGEIVPMFVENSFADGLRPTEYAAGMFGARASVISTKSATAKGGDYGKLLSQASSRLLITDEDCGVDNGVAYDVEDNTPKNRLLSKAIGGYEAGTLLTRQVLADLKKQNIKKVVARSPLTCNADGLCSKCVGKTFEDKFPKVGEHVGITSANALCLDEDTEVLMYGGSYKKIKDINPGEIVYGVDENGVISPSAVLDNYDRGIQECFSYVHEKGSLVATKNHRCVFLKEDNFSLLHLHEIEAGDFFVTPCKKKLQIEKITSAGLRPTRDLYIDHPNHVFLIKDFIQVHNSEPVTQGALCLAKGTVVRMADGLSKEIENIEIGEYVLGSDINGNTFPTLVKDKFSQGVKKVYLTKFENELSVASTLSHNFLIKPNVVNIIGAVDEVLTAYGTVKVLNHSFIGDVPCFDIEVEHSDHLFVLDNGLIVSNSAKHTGGQAVQRGEYGGFEILSQFVQSPKEYKHKSITADEEGQVSQIEDAPQGGWNVFVNNKPYYVRPEYPLTVKVGDYVEAGAPISEGIIDARDVVEKVGLGAGRKYWSDRLQKIYKDSGLYADKKNIEIVARGALDTVNIEEDIDGIDAYVDDTVNYNKLKKSWKPTAATKLSTDMAKNKYLAKDTLHHTIGTKITPTIQKELNEVGITEVDALDKPPPFKPNMDRLRTVSHYNDDWLAGLSTSYLKKQLEESTLRAATTDIASNQHWAPRIAVGVGFGQNIEQTGKF